MSEGSKKIVFRWWWLAAALCGGCVPLPEQNQPSTASATLSKTPIAYQDGVAIKGNHAVFGFRPMPVRNETAEVTEKIEKSPLEVSQCLQRHLESQFKLPTEFYTVNTYTNNAQTIALVNPFTKTEGLQMDITETGVNNSTVKLYANGTVLSEAWKRFPTSCR